ncbi:hypothetical protein D3H65_26625 [Paraflavitalea soli]|uniref:Lipocalin-like domain-containing protein n=1 Tax=Paraflavitalea soli TaxID=2315862 RepID=A0A3B7MU04_9BACT|nr:hypothetical protein [Paraflavitalea soli]AXY77337.1 hypothetical protein D3H65_26625 [Paraflavitalea soli]
MKIMSNLSKGLVTAACLIAVVFAACKKDASSSTDQTEKQEYATNTTQADAESDAVFDDVLSNVLGVNSDVAIGGTGVFAGRTATPPTNGKEYGVDGPTCFTVAFTKLNGTNAFPLQATIDFGAGCTGPDGRTRKGKMIIVYTGRLILPGNSATTTFDGFYLDSLKVEGTHKVTNTSTQDKRSFAIEVSSAKLTRANGNYSTWNSAKTITQTGGAATLLDLSDDVFTITGQASGTLKKGDKTYQWDAVITTPLVKKLTCWWIGQGTITISHNNTPVGVLDYGTGQCDRKATLTVNGVVFEISLV